MHSQARRETVVRKTAQIALLCYVTGSFARISEFRGIARAIKSRYLAGNGVAFDRNVIVTEMNVKKRALAVRLALSLGILAISQARAASPSVYVSEIMYHPPGTNHLEQWFELSNSGSKAVDLTGWSVTKGVRFAFSAGTVIPAGGYLVVAADAATFRASHPDVTNFVAGWSGKLGHVVEISDSTGKAVNSVEFYSDGDWARRVIGPVQYNHQGWTWDAPADGSGASLELVNPSLPNSYANNWAPNKDNSSTPGHANSVASSDAAPFISGVAHWPPVPHSTDSVSITARVVDEAPAGVSVILNWRLDGQASFSQVTMADDGAHGEGIAGDELYGATIPAQGNHGIVEFFITATDQAGHTRRYPNFIPPQNSSRTANLLYQVDNANYSGPQPLYRIIMTDVERAELYALGRTCPDSDSDAEMNGTWITQDGVLAGGTTTQVRYNVGVRNRGHGTRQSNPNNYHVNIPADRLWKGQAGLNLNSQYAFSQVIGSAVMRKSGLAMPDSRAVQVRVNGTNLMSLPLPDINSFGSYAANEQYNNDFIKRTFPLDPGGNSYRGIRDEVLCIASLHGVADLTWHGADWQVPVYTNAYYKQNNFIENDWSDLIKLLSVLNVTNGTTASTYVDDIQKVMNVDEWMIYMAANTLIDNEETALANGVGDDYATYRGAIDTRFQALPYDLDTVLGRGSSSVSPRNGIFRMTNLPAMDRFMKTPQFAPIYFAKLKQLADTVFSSEQMDPLLDQLLGDFVPADTLSAMKAFNASHRAYVLSQIPLSFTATTTLPQVSGYYHTTTAGAAISGSANAIDTRTVLVNGTQANWVAWEGQWNVSNVPLNPGLNRLVIRALGTNDNEIGRTNLDVWFDDGSIQTAGGTISTDTHWTAAGGPYDVSSSLTISSGATLTIDPGTTVYLGSGANLTIANGGRLLAEGTEAAPIRFTRAPGASANWGGIVIDGAVGSPETRIAYAHIEFNGATAIHSSSGTVYLDHLTFGTSTQQYVSLDSSSFVVSNCHFPTPTAGFEPNHGTGGIKQGGHGLFLRNFFGAPNGYNDVVDFTGGQRGGPIVYFINNVLMGGGDDGFDIDGTDAWIEGNIFMHIHQNGAPDSSSAVSGGDDSGNTSEITIVGNLMFDCDNAATAKQGNFFTFFNNTIVRTTKEGGNDFESGIVNVRDTTPSLTAFGKGYYLEGNIITDADQLVRNYDPQQVTVTFNNNILPYAWEGPGTNNYIGNALLTHIPTVAEAQFDSWDQAQVMRQWLSPRAGSPARGSGPEGKDKGGVIPRGVYITGQPVGTNNQASVTLHIGLNRQGSGIPASGWPQGSGYTAYKWRLDAGPWSAETSIDQPIQLTGLANGPHSVDVAGKTDGGLYQDDPMFGPDATITSTGTWYVDTGAAPLLQVRINEILARNVSSLTNNDSSPDLVELYNYGSANADLSGLRLSQHVAGTVPFILPAGTTLGAGEFLVLYADVKTTNQGIHLGFALNASGDTLYLFDQSSNLLDSVQFGQQIPDFSVGRGFDGTWTLCRPTPGSANAPAALGDPQGLRINEWLTDREFSAKDSFIELYNPDQQPVELSGLYLSDAAGAPNRFPIPALSYIAPNGFTVFAADGNNGAGHVNFKLSPDVGLINLSAPDLTTIDLVEYGPQSTDVSEGRSPNGAAFITSFDQPTPGASNPGSSAGGSTNIVRTTTPLVSLTDTWRYNEAGVNLGTAWRDNGYDDSAWPQGPALFYHGNAPTRMPIPVATQLAFKSPEQSAYYFRAHFSYAGPTNNLTFNLTDIIDDGLVVYLNGLEIYRHNMPAGTINYSTFSSTTISDATQLGPVSIPAANLQDGDNVLAVEVHQANLSSSDIAMALALDAVISETNSVVSGSSIPTLVFNEVLARNLSFPSAGGTTSDWIEIYNPSTNTFDLAGVSITDDLSNARKFTFAQNTTIAGQSYLVLNCNSALSPSTNNTAFGLELDGGTIYLFDAPARGGALLDSIRYGIQVPDMSVGRVPDGTGDWTLNTPTPGAVNHAPSLGSTAKLRINEWLASSSTGSDWFELFNSDSAPVPLSGLFLTDDLTDRAKFHIQPLSFIGAGSNAFLRIDADSAPEKGARHVNFNLSVKGEEIGLYDSLGASIDSVVFGPQQPDISQGRLPDGFGAITNFSVPTPGGPNGVINTNDSDHDGLPDDWELANFGTLTRDGTGDFDGDGFTDLQEFLAGTDPKSPAAYLRIDSAGFTGNTFVLRVEVVAGKTYRLESSDDLNSGAWQKVVDIPVQNNSGTLDVSDPTAQPAQTRFYRLRLQ
jgi:hypothetical protein